MSRKTIAIALLFVALVLVGDRMAGELMERLFLKSKFRYAELYKGDLPGDIAILGNSRGLHMFHPPSIEEITGSSVANLSFNGNPASILPVIWEDYLANHSPPKVLILEISCAGSAQEPGSLERFSVLADQNPRFNDLIINQNPQSGWGNRVSRLFRYNSNLMWRSLLFLKNSDQSWIMNSTLNPAMIEKVVGESDTTLRRVPENVEALREVIERAAEAGVKVKLVLAPYLPAYYQRLEAPTEWREWLEAELGHPIVDHAALLEKNEWFVDHIHLNENGARELATRLHENGFFDADHR